MNGCDRHDDIDHEMWDLYEEWPGQRYGFGGMSAPGPDEETLARLDYETGRTSEYRPPMRKLDSYAQETSYDRVWELRRKGYDFLVTIKEAWIN